MIFKNSEQIHYFSQNISLIAAKQIRLSSDLYPSSVLLQNDHGESPDETQPHHVVAQLGPTLLVEKYGQQHSRYLCHHAREHNEIQLTEGHLH